MTSDFPKVTIGIPTYNRADKTLSTALQSACSQDYANLEILISDNCSTDNTQELVSSFKDPRISYIRQKTNIGPNGNFNACLKAASGDYFILLHDDDLIDSDFVSTCMEKANYSKNYGFIRTGTRIINEKGKHLSDISNTVSSDSADDLFLAWVTLKTPIYLCSTIFNTTALKNIGGFKSKNNLFEDGFAIIKLSADHPLLNIPDIKASFRQHAEQRTYSASIPKWSEDFRMALDMIYLQNPPMRRDIYEKGMISFSKIVIKNFACKVKNPIRRAIAIIGVGRYFPYYYWPNSPGTSLKLKTARLFAKIFFRRSKCLLK